MSNNKIIAAAVLIAVVDGEEAVVTAADIAASAAVYEEFVRQHVAGNRAVFAFQEADEATLAHAVKFFAGGITGWGRWGKVFTAVSTAAEVAAEDDGLFKAAVEHICAGHAW
jgi:hypothetical protein